MFVCECMEEYDTCECDLDSDDDDLDLTELADDS